MTSYRWTGEGHYTQPSALSHKNSCCRVNTNSVCVSQPSWLVSKINHQYVQCAIIIHLQIRVQLQVLVLESTQCPTVRLQVGLQQYSITSQNIIQFIQTKLNRFEIITRTSSVPSTFMTRMDPIQRSAKCSYKQQIFRIQYTCFLPIQQPISWQYQK